MKKKLILLILISACFLSPHSSSFGAEKTINIPIVDMDITIPNDWHSIPNTPEDLAPFGITEYSQIPSSEENNPEAVLEGIYYIAENEDETMALCVAVSHSAYSQTMFNSDLIPDTFPRDADEIYQSPAATYDVYNLLYDSNYSSIDYATLINGYIVGIGFSYSAPATDNDIYQISRNVIDNIKFNTIENTPASTLRYIEEWKAANSAADNQPNRSYFPAALTISAIIIAITIFTVKKHNNKK